MNIKNLEAFCRLAELEHYGKTADELGIAQPTLSRTIKRIEEELGVVLFRHHGRNIHLTKIGKIYYESVQQGLEKIAAGTKSVRDLVDPYSGSIDLGFIFTLGPEIIPQLLQQFRSDSHRRNFKFKFWQGNSPRLIENVKNETCDFGRLPVNRTMKYLKILRATFHLMKSSFFAYSRDNFRAISWWIMF